MSRLTAPSTRRRDCVSERTPEEFVFAAKLPQTIVDRTEELRGWADHDPRCAALFSLARRLFCASDIRLLASAVTRRPPRLPVLVWAGFRLVDAAAAVPSRATIARSRRSRSAFSSVSIVSRLKVAPLLGVSAVCFLASEGSRGSDRVYHYAAVGRYLSHFGADCERPLLDDTCTWAEMIAVAAGYTSAVVAAAYVLFGIVTGQGNVFRSHAGAAENKNRESGDEKRNREDIALEFPVLGTRSKIKGEAGPPAKSGSPR